MPTPVKTYREHLDEVLVDPESTLQYLQASIAEGVDVFLVALGDVVQARGGGFAQRAEVHRILSEEGNLTARHLDTMVRALGFRLSVESLQEPEARDSRVASSS